MLGYNCKKSDNPMDISSFQARVLQCKIESIRLPRFLPSVLFITWRADTFNGQSKLVRANAPLKQIEDTFELPSSTVTEIEFALQAKSPLGTLYRFGEAKIVIPESINDMKPHSEIFKISSDAGDFFIQIILQLKEIDNTMELDPSLAILLQTPSTLLGYVELAKTIPYNLEKKLAKTEYFADNGILHQLNGLPSKKPNNETNNELKKLLPSLQTKIEQSKFLARIVKNLGTILMVHYPLFVMLEDGKVVDGNEARNNKAPKIPLLGLYVSSVLRDFDSGKDSIEGVDIEAPILQLSDMIGGISSNKNVSEQWQIYLISTSIFIMEYIRENFSDKYFTTSTILEMGMRNALITFVESYKLEVSPICNSPIKMKSKLSLKKSFLETFSIPNVVYEVVSKYLYKVMDYLAGTKWIMSDELESPDSNHFKEVMPEYDWPLLTGIDYILNNLSDIYAGRISKSSIYQPLSGEWLKLILSKFIGHETYKFTERKIESLCRGDSHEPTLQNLDEWGQESFKFVGHFQLPDKLPEIPANLIEVINSFQNLPGQSNES